MLSRFVHYQLVAFGMIAVLGLGITAFAYAGLPALLGFGRYSTTVQLPAAGGLYEGAAVTMRGVEIGEVSAVRLSPQGVDAVLSLDDSVDVPADVSVAVRQTSAIGEQYVELTPGPDGAAETLAEGAVLPVAKASVPTPVNQVLDSADALVRSVPQDSLRTTIDEFGKAFSGTGSDLQRLIDGSDTLLGTAQDNLGPTTALINDLQPVLGTQVAESGNIRSFLSDLASFSGQLRTDDAALRGTIEKTPAFTGEVRTLFGQIRPTVPVLLGNLTSVGQVLETYVPGIRHTLVVLPAVVNNVQTAGFNNRGVPTGAGLDFKATVNDPPACVVGFDTPVRDGSETAPLAAPTDSYCKEPADSEKEVRGKRQNPCPDDPTRRSPDAAGCGLNFQTPEEAARSAEAARYDPLASGLGTYDGATVPEGVPYDARTGLFFGPDGGAFALGEATRAGTVPPTWKAFFLDPLGIPTS